MWSAAHAAADLALARKNTEGRAFGVSLNPEILSPYEAAGANRVFLVA